MKVLIALAMLCIVACAAQRRNFGGGPKIGDSRHALKFGSRFRREPQTGYLTVHGEKHLTGRDKRPSLDVHYHQPIVDEGRTRVTAFGGGRLQSGHVSPQAGLGVEHNFDNGAFIRGQTQVQPGPHGRLSPSVGIGAGMRFRREAMPYEEEEAAPEFY